MWAGALPDVPNDRLGREHTLRDTGMTKTLFSSPGRDLTPFFHAESDVYLVTLGGAGLILHADEQALRLRASNAERSPP